MSKLRKARIERICRRKLKSGALTEKQKAAVKAILDDQLGMNLLTERVSGFVGADAAEAEGERPFLDWLVANWKTILDMILAIIKALGI